MPPHSTSPSPCPREIQARPGFRRPSRQKTPAIVHDQGISRLRMKNNNAISRAPTARPHTSPGQRPGFVPGMPSALKGRSIPPKTPVIVHDQGISRHPQKNHPAPWKLAAWSCSGAWRLEFGASPPHPLCVKTPAIKANRASSRKTMKLYNPSHPAPFTERGSMNRSIVTTPAGVMICPRACPDDRTLLRVTDPRSAIRAPLPL